MNPVGLQGGSPLLDCLSARATHSRTKMDWLPHDVKVLVLTERAW